MIDGIHLSILDLGLGTCFPNLLMHRRVARRNMRRIPHCRWSILLERHDCHQGMGANHELDHWLADAGGKLDGCVSDHDESIRLLTLPGSNHQYQLWRRTVDPL